MLAVFAQFETDVRRDRQAEGIARAKKAGVYTGGKPRIDREAILAELRTAAVLHRLRVPWAFRACQSIGSYERPHWVVAAQRRAGREKHNQFAGSCSA